MKLNENQYLNSHGLSFGHPLFEGDHFSCFLSSWKLAKSTMWNRALAFEIADPGAKILYILMHPYGTSINWT